MPEVRVPPPADDDRYQVTEVAGYLAVPPGQVSTFGISFSVTDTCDAHREVATFYALPRNIDRRSSYERRRAAYVHAHRLNTADREHEAQFPDNAYAD